MKELNNCEIMGDALDEYRAHQEAELLSDEMQGDIRLDDEEIKAILLELWEEFN